MTTSPRPTAGAAGPRDATIIWQFVLAGVIWGSSFLFMKVALEGVSPAQVAWSRLVLGGLTLGAFVLLRREHLPRRIRVWGHMLVLAISFCVVPFMLFSWAQQHVTSGLASIFNATTPIMTAIMAWAVFRVERLSAAQIAGILVGIGGVMVIIAPWQGLDAGESLVAQLAILGATACYGFSLAYMRRFASDTGMSPLVFSFLGVILGVVLLGEHLTWNEPVGALLVFLGILLAQGRLGRRRPRRWRGADAAASAPRPRSGQATSSRSITKISVLPPRK